MILDKLCDGYSSSNQSLEILRKQKIEDEREIESILNHFMDLDEREEEFEEALLNYINVRKELNKQITGGASSEEYLQERKR